MKQIVVYADKGVDGVSLGHALKSLKLETDLHSHFIKRMDAQALITTDWEKDTALLVFPGGRDIYYHAALSGTGTERIRAFVENGGSYLGLCAGAYFASSSIEFEKGGHLEVCGKRSLAFFPGAAVGPALGLNKYTYDSERGAEAAWITWNQKQCHAYYNGGCSFESPESHPDVEVLSSYLSADTNKTAVVNCHVGKGRAILSGVHIEYCAPLLTHSNPYIDKLKPFLEESEPLRKLVFREILAKLGVNLV